MTSRNRTTCLGIVALVIGLSSPASALLRVGDIPGDFNVSDADDHQRSFSSFCRARPTLVIFEGKDGGNANLPFLDRLGVLRRSSATYAKTQVLPIADISGFDFWPARGIAKGILKKESKRGGLTVWADWSGEGRRHLAADPKRSNLFLLDAQCKVLWASAGGLQKEHQDALLAKIASLGNDG